MNCLRSGVDHVGKCEWDGDVDVAVVLVADGSSEWDCEREDSYKLEDPSGEIDDDEAALTGQQMRAGLVQRLGGGGGSKVAPVEVVGGRGRSRSRSQEEHGGEE